MEVHAAERYEGVDDLWTITCVFNPSGYRTKLENYHRFAEKFRESGLPLLTVECAFSGEPFTLPSNPDVIQVRSDSILWQKERLLNIALERLPSGAKKVVWIDSDLLFADPGWAVQTSKLLDSVAFAQPYQEWIRLPENNLSYHGEGETGFSFASTSQTDPGSIAQMQHGLPGFAWAGRREILEKFGFYDACIIGGGDHMMAHALTGTPDSNCVHRIVGLRPRKERSPISKLFGYVSDLRPNRFAEHYRSWASAIYTEVRSPLGCVPGRLLHLWHGSSENRRYYQRHKELRRFHYNPTEDLWINQDGTWEWNGRRSDMHRWAENYFRQRQEDG